MYNVSTIRVAYKILHCPKTLLLIHLADLQLCPQASYAHGIIKKGYTHLE
jgi:hypothetical protein